MSKPLPDTAHPGPHPTLGEFADLLTQWGFQPVRERRGNRFHDSLRGPHGGRIHVLTSRQGRADADLIARAARLAHVEVATFLAGPPSTAVLQSPVQPPTQRTAGRPGAEEPDAEEPDAEEPDAEEPDAEEPDAPERPALLTAASSASPQPGHLTRGDSVMSLVLTTHVGADRPLRFEEVVDLCGGRVTRTQVREASSQLCRAGELDRICAGVYQWAYGARRLTERPAGRPAESPQPVAPPTPRQPGPQPPVLVPEAASTATDPIVDKLFTTLFPQGIRTTPQLLREIQQWTELTRTLAAHADPAGTRSIHPASAP